MTIELHLNGEYYRAWILDDIREEFTESGEKKWQKQIDREIIDLKRDNYQVLEFNEYEFFVVYESRLNLKSISSNDMITFEKQIKIKQAGRFIGKYNQAS